MPGATTHVLLIGINDYPEPLLTSLTGCVNDVDDIQAVLIDQLGVPSSQITRLTAPVESGGPVPARLPTRQHILEALEALGGDEIRPEHRVFIYYSGHGDFVEVRGAAGVTRREVLVPVDVRIEVVGKPGRNVIYDVELIRLLRRIAERTQQITVILDACHSTGAARGTSGARAASDVPRSACLGGSLSQAEWEAEGRDARSDGGLGIIRGLGGSLDSCVVAAACLANETAVEGTHEDGRRGGYFSRALLGRLREFAPAELPELRWGQIWRQLVGDLARRVEQHPQLLGSFARKVFGGPPEFGDTGFPVARDGDDYRVGVGELAGVTTGAILGVYGSAPFVLPRIDSPEERQARLGTLVVTGSKPGSSRARLAEGTTHTALEKGTRGRIVRPGDPSLSVAFAPPELLDAGLRAKLTASGFIRLAEAEERPGVVIRRCDDGSWALTDDLYGTGDDPEVPALVRIAPASPPELLVALLHHYAVYIAPVEFARRCNDPPANLLRLSLLDCSGKEMSEKGFVVEDGFDPQSPDLPRIGTDAAGRCVVREDHNAFCIEVQNNGPRLLYVTLFECGASGRVYALGKAAISGRGRHVFWCGEAPGCTFRASVPGGRRAGFDRVVAIGTTVADADLSFMRTDVSFAQILAGDPSRDSRGGPELLERWTSDLLALRVERAGADDVDVARSRSTMD